MVSFSCAKCGDVVKKPKVQSHAGSCGTNSYSCVDCMKVFDLHTINNHTNCISEVQKYQGKYTPDYSKPVAKDSDDEEENKNSATRGLKRPARPKMNFKDSDSDEDNAPKKTSQVPKKAATPKQAPKRTRDDSDSDDDNKAKAAKAKPRTASPALHPKAATTSAKKSVSPSLNGKASPSAKLETLNLPTTRAADLTKEYAISGEPISLGTHELLGELVDEIIAEQRALNHNTHPNEGVIGQELVLRYRKRLGKAITKAIAPVLRERGL
eukprot:GILI01014978.1.p1 GENE.GILI01014978.1~~GILI01014978.1.p1  ORF type:complete len:268 (-),score=60.86 GILI01014978.1:117-920(-)